MCAVVASLEPWWAPGTRVGYHAVTFGFILGEVVRRLTGSPISAVLHLPGAWPPRRTPERWMEWPPPRRPGDRVGQSAGQAARAWRSCSVMISEP
ncbi:beta-lactamase family protein [Streptomyces sp. SID13031]|uniref:beta-lactamase family protein n=1 Tax=Streptomyces sp. SID13031 TaxID=2706046 RepID=UPI001EF2AFA0|nr:beta-lactamase family protein [Streptomyces sp. SID13031]